MYAIHLTTGIQLADNLTDAREVAQRHADQHRAEVEVTTRGTGAVVYTATYVHGRYFHPFERVENVQHWAPGFEGWRVAYSRKRIEATVYRGVDANHGLWRVFDGRTGAHVDVRGTRGACVLTREMGQGRLL